MSGVESYLRSVAALQSGNNRSLIISSGKKSGRLVKTTFRKRPEGWLYDSIDEFLLKFGLSWTPKPLPPKMKLGRVGECFRNAFLLVEKRPELSYVEGFASRNNVPVPHAWAVNRGGEVLDQTWRPVPGLSDPEEYFGVPFSMKYVRRIVTNSQVWGVLYNWLTCREQAHSYTTLEDPKEFFDERWNHTGSSFISIEIKR